MRIVDYRLLEYPDANYYVVLLRWHGSGQPWPPKSMPGYKLEASLEWRSGSPMAFPFMRLGDAEESFSYWDECLRNERVLPNA